MFTQGHTDAAARFDEGESMLQQGISRARESIHEAARREALGQPVRLGGVGAMTGPTEALNGLVSCLVECLPAEDVRLLLQHAADYWVERRARPE